MKNKVDGAADGAKGNDLFGMSVNLNMNSKLHDLRRLERQALLDEGTNKV
jgi:hypothetical protein